MKYLAVYPASKVFEATDPLNVTFVPFQAEFSNNVFASQILLPLPLPSDQKGSTAL